MNTTVLKVDNNSEFAQSFLEFVQTLPYVKIELPKVAKRTKKEAMAIRPIPKPITLVRWGYMVVPN